MTDISELIARIEAATGPDQELDAEIHLLATKNTIACVADIMAGCELGWEHPAYTASIDAALKLAPEGWDWIIGASAGSKFPVANLGRSYPTNKNVAHEAATPALALCAAALKARNP